MNGQSIAPLAYDFRRSLLPQHGITVNDLRGLASDLERAREEILHVDLPMFQHNQPVPAIKQPLDAGFHMLPDRLLEEYESQRTRSELGQILTAAQRMRDSVDRVVVLGIGGSYMGAKALMDACCHPYHNELDRGARGGRPRMYFDGNNVDNDATQALLDILPNGGQSLNVADRWGLIVISKSGGTLETAVALRHYLRALRSDDHHPASDWLNRFIPVTGASGKLHDLAKSFGCQTIFSVPEGVGGRFSVLSAVGLLPAAILGIDIVQLLRGAAAMNRHFRDTPVSDNVVLNYVGVGHLMERLRNATLRILSVWSKSLESLGLWYDQLLAESLGKAEVGATPLTVVNTRDLHSRAQQHQEGRRDKLITNLVVDSVRRDPIALARESFNQDQLNHFAGKTLPEFLNAALVGTNEAYAADQRPTTDLHLPAADEASLGQFLQMMMLATVVEGRLLEINPYGQPGVEQYKVRMKQILEG